MKASRIQSLPTSGWAAWGMLCGHPQATAGLPEQTPEAALSCLMKPLPWAVMGPVGPGRIWEQAQRQKLAWGWWDEGSQTAGTTGESESQEFKELGARQDWGRRVGAKEQRSECRRSLSRPGERSAPVRPVVAP